MKVLKDKNLLIGVVVIIALCVLYWGVNFLKGVNLLQPSNFYYAEFEKVNGLTKSAPVSINGYQVGLVRDITYNYDNNKISVLMSLNDNLKIPEGSYVYIAKGLINNDGLVLVLGNSKQYQSVGSKIRVNVQDDLLASFQAEMMPKIADMLPKIDSILSSLNTVMANPAINSSVTRLDDITANLDNCSRQIDALLVSINKQAPSTLGNIHDITTELKATSSNLKDLSAHAKSLPLDTTVNRLNATVANLQAVTAKLNDKDSSLGMLLNDKSLYNNVNGSAASLDSLLQDIRRNPKRYVTIKVF